MTYSVVEPRPWAEQIPLSLLARTFPIPALRFRMRPQVNARSLTLCWNDKGLRVWRHDREQMEIGAIRFGCGLPRCVDSCLKIDQRITRFSHSSASSVPLCRRSLVTAD